MDVVPVSDPQSEFTILNGAVAVLLPLSDSQAGAPLVLYKTAITLPALQAVCLCLELRLRVGYRNYIHADRGDMPAERQVTWRGCARDWITNGDPYQNDKGYQSDPSYPPGMKCKRTGILRNEEIAPGEEELHCLCPDSLCNEHVVVLGEWGEYTYSA